MEGRPLEDTQLVERARGGDIGAYEELVQRYQEIAFRTAYLVTRSAADAEDAAQEAFVKAYYALDHFRSGASFRPWILAIVANEARNRVRSAARRNALRVRLSADRASGDAAPSPEVAAVEESDRRRVLEALGTLSPNDRLAIAYRYFFEMTEAEMAQAMGVRPGTVKSRLARALARLRSALGDMEVSA